MPLDAEVWSVFGAMQDADGPAFVSLSEVLRLLAERHLKGAVIRRGVEEAERLRLQRFDGESDDGLEERIWTKKAERLAALDDEIVSGKIARDDARLLVEWLDLAVLSWGGSAIEAAFAPTDEHLAVCLRAILAFAVRGGDA
jgi:hypothetical protein